MRDHEAIRKQLLERRDELNQLINKVTDHVCHTDSPLPSDFSEQAVERENEEVMDALGAASRVELSQINRTLARMDEGEYGICSSCGAEIPEARLEIVPHAEFCVACADKQGN